MLSVLKIKNIAIIESAEIEFSRGFNVLSGETGAGKSIILDSINAVLGFRTSRELIRTGESQAEVSALFSFVGNDVLRKLDELGIEKSDDNTVVISRIIANDKNICRVNGTLANVSVLRELGSYLINIHGQQDNRELLNSETHLSYVDAVSGTEDLLKDYLVCYNNLQEIKHKIKNISSDKSEKARRIDILKFQIEELRKADIKIGEWNELKSKQQELLNFEKIQNSYNNAFSILSGDDDNVGVVQLLSALNKEISSISSCSKDAENISSVVSDAYYNLADVSDTIRSCLNDDYSPEQLEEIEDRLDILYKLSKKYGDTEEEMLSYLNSAVEELENISFSDEKLQQLIDEKEKSEKEALIKAKILSNKRREAAKIFSENVCNELKYLDMTSVKFYVDFKDIDLCENGIDFAEFYISANIGEEPKPMAKISSGGELSRIMLALKTILADKDKVSTMVFDEIDTGVSGRAAMKIASKLRQLASDKQIICVTHLAQIASAADSHYLIEKSSDTDKTYTKVTLLSDDKRKYEIARIIGGGDVTLSQLQSAEELINLNR